MLSIIYFLEREKECNQEKTIKTLSNLKSRELAPNPRILYTNSAQHHVPCLLPFLEKGSNK